MTVVSPDGTDKREGCLKQSSKGLYFWKFITNFEQLSSQRLVLVDQNGRITEGDLVDWVIEF